MQRHLCFVDEDGARRVHGPDAHDALAHAGAPHERHQTVSEVDQLYPLVGFDGNGVGVNDQPTGLRSSRSRGRFSDRDGRALAHAVLSNGSTRGVRHRGAKHSILLETQQKEQRVLYSRHN